MRLPLELLRRSKFKIEINFAISLFIIVFIHFLYTRTFLSTFNFVCSLTRQRYRIACIIFYSKYPSNVSKQQNCVRDSSGFESAIKIWSKTIVCKLKKSLNEQQTKSREQQQNIVIQEQKILYSSTREYLTNNRINFKFIATLFALINYLYCTILTIF